MTGLVLSIGGALATWIKTEMGPHWYPLALVVLALPGAWLGARLEMLGDKWKKRNRELETLKQDEPPGLLAVSFYASAGALAIVRSGAMGWDREVMRQTL